MRCIEKGASPRQYKDYHDARNDLAGRIGWYCAYCEMRVTNMIEVEHVHPVNHGGNELDWNNFLLSCRYCNGIKTDRNTSRRGYLWPDIDNTIHAFDYSEVKVIEPAYHLHPAISAKAEATINLMGLNRIAHSGKEPTDRDSRWIIRIEVFGIIQTCLEDWQEAPTTVTAQLIAKTALGHGFYSFWIQRFANYPLVLDAINSAFPNTYLPISDGTGNWKLRNSHSSY